MRFLFVSYRFHESSFCHHNFADTIEQRHCIRIPCDHAIQLSFRFQYYRTTAGKFETNFTGMRCRILVIVRKYVRQLLHCCRILSHTLWLHFNFVFRFDGKLFSRRTNAVIFGGQFVEKFYKRIQKLLRVRQNMCNLETWFL